MFKNILFTLFILPISLLGQQINIDSCNETPTVAARSNCIKAYIESFIYSETLKDSTLSKNKQTFKLNFLIDQIGNIYADTNFSEDSLKLAIVDRVVKKIKPLDVYKNQQGELLDDYITIDLNIKKEDPKPALNNATTTEKTEGQIEKKEIPFAVIEKVPVYPSCYENNNADLKKCMSLQVSKHIGNNFNTAIAYQLGLPNGKQRVSGQFKINKEGFVVNIRARAPHPRLEQETIRVIESLPRMTPGEQKGKKVGVLYAVPIIFEIEGQAPKRQKRKRKKSN